MNTEQNVMLLQNLTENGEPLPENENTTVVVAETTQTTQPPTPAEEVKQDTTGTEKPTTKKQVVKTEKNKVSKAKKRIPYTTNLSEEQHNYLKPIIADLIKFKVCENPSDFVAKCIDFYVNYQAVCREHKQIPTLLFPIPDGTNGSIEIEHKLLKQSLFTAISKLPTV